MPRNHHEVNVILCQRAPRLPASLFSYNFSILPTCGFSFGDAGTRFHVEYTPHPPTLKGLKEF